MVSIRFYISYLIKFMKFIIYLNKGFKCGTCNLFKVLTLTGDKPAKLEILDSVHRLLSEIKLRTLNEILSCNTTMILKLLS